MATNTVDFDVFKKLYDAFTPNREQVTEALNDYAAKNDGRKYKSAHAAIDRELKETLEGQLKAQGNDVKLTRADITDAKYAALRNEYASAMKDSSRSTDAIKAVADKYGISTTTIRRALKVSKDEVAEARAQKIEEQVVEAVGKAAVGNGNEYAPRLTVYNTATPGDNQPAQPEIGTDRVIVPESVQNDVRQRIAEQASNALGAELLGELEAEEAQPVVELTPEQQAIEASRLSIRAALSEAFPDPAGESMAEEDVAAVVAAQEGVDADVVDELTSEQQALHANLYTEDQARIDEQYTFHRRLEDQFGNQPADGNAVVVGPNGTRPGMRTYKAATPTLAERAKNYVSSAADWTKRNAAAIVLTGAALFGGYALGSHNKVSKADFEAYKAQAVAVDKKPADDRSIDQKIAAAIKKWEDAAKQAEAKATAAAQELADYKATDAKADAAREQELAQARDATTALEGKLAEKEVVVKTLGDGLVAANNAAKAAEKGLTDYKAQDAKADAQRANEYKAEQKRRETAEASANAAEQRAKDAEAARLKAQQDADKRVAEAAKKAAEAARTEAVRQAALLAEQKKQDSQKPKTQPDLSGGGPDQQPGTGVAPAATTSVSTTYAAPAPQNAKLTKIKGVETAAPAAVPNHMPYWSDRQDGTTDKDQIDKLFGKFNAKTATPDQVYTRLKQEASYWRSALSHGTEKFFGSGSAADYMAATYVREVAAHNFAVQKGLLTGTAATQSQAAIDDMLVSYMHVDWEKDVRNGKKTVRKFAPGQKIDLTAMLKIADLSLLAPESKLTPAQAYKQYTTMPKNTPGLDEAMSLARYCQGRIYGVEALGKLAAAKDGIKSKDANVKAAAVKNLVDAIVLAEMSHKASKDRALDKGAKKLRDEAKTLLGSVVSKDKAEKLVDGVVKTANEKIGKDFGKVLSGELGRDIWGGIYNYVIATNVPGALLPGHSFDLWLNPPVSPSSALNAAGGATFSQALDLGLQLRKTVPAFDAYEAQFEKAGVPTIANDMSLAALLNAYSGVKANNGVLTIEQLEALHTPAFAGKYVVLRSDKNRGQSFSIADKLTDTMHDTAHDQGVNRLFLMAYARQFGLVAAEYQKSMPGIFEGLNQQNMLTILNEVQKAVRTGAMINNNVGGNGSHGKGKGGIKGGQGGGNEFGGGQGSQGGLGGGQTGGGEATGFGGQ